MPYVQVSKYGWLWEGERTEREELELYEEMSSVSSFPSANHRSALRRKEREEAEETIQSEE